MADYYTEASFKVPLNPEQIKFAFDVLDCAQDERIDFKDKHKNTAAKSFFTEVYKTAKKLALSFDDAVYIDFNIERQDDGIWISHETSIDTEIASYFVYLILKHFNLDICVAIEASHTCSKPRLDAFGGHAAFVTKNGVKWMSTRQWINKQTDAFNKSLAA